MVFPFVIGRLPWGLPKLGYEAFDPFMTSGFWDTGVSEDLVDVVDIIRD